MGDPGRQDDAVEDVGTSDRWEDEFIPGHEYDGIREYDNPIPSWLSLIFLGTIVWSLFYLVAINLGYIARYEESLERGQRELANMRQKARSQQKEITPELLASAVEDEQRLEKGGKVFEEQCASCHKENGGGQIGPNLTDAYWIHGGSLESIYRTINNGVTEKGMPAWKSQLSQNKRIAVTAYVRSLLGTDPPGAKEPEGEKYEPDQ